MASDTTQSGVFAILVGLVMVWFARNAGDKQLTTEAVGVMEILPGVRGWNDRSAHQNRRYLYVVAVIMMGIGLGLIFWGLTGNA